MGNKILTMLCVYLFMSLAFSQVQSRQIYTMEDLSILESENNFKEFFAHALDIKPSKRDKTWSSLVESMGIHYLDQLTKNRFIDKDQKLLLLKISNWTFFKNNEIFIQKRDTVLVKMLKQCFKLGSKDCFSNAEIYFYNYKHSKEFAFHLTQVLVDNGAIPKTLWPYIDKFTQDTISEFYCDKPSLKNIILAKVYALKENQLNIVNNIHPDCFKKVKKEITKGLFSNSETKKKRSYRLLDLKNELTPKDKSFYLLTQYLQDSKMTKTAMDMAITQLRELGENYQRREEVLKKLVKIDPLPGGIFKENKSDMAKIRILSRHFPEYIDNYTKTCLDYLEGNKEYTNGNPTPHCHSLFKLNPKLNLLPQNMLKRYKDAIQFAF